MPLSVYYCEHPLIQTSSEVIGEVYWEVTKHSFYLPQCLNRRWIYLKLLIPCLFLNWPVKSKYEVNNVWGIETFTSLFEGDLQTFEG